MDNRPERRHLARLSLPAELSGPGLEAHEVRLCDLSPQGARIEHFRPLPDWNMCLLVLPQALGGLRLQGKAIWSRALGRKQIAKGEKQVSYQRGLTFTFLTPDQREGLTAALKILEAAQEAPPPAGPTGTANDRGGATRSMAKQPDRRHITRLVIPSQLGSPGLEDQEVRLVDFSLEGARVEHLKPLDAGLMCVADLPPSGAAASAAGSCGANSIGPNTAWRASGGATSRVASPGPGSPPGSSVPWRPRWSSSRPPRRYESARRLSPS